MPPPAAVPPASALPSADTALTGALGSIKSTPGKYDEYQSICRENEYDIVASMSAEDKKKRIDEINENIKKSLISTKPKILLYKELIDQDNKVEAEKLFNSLKAEKLSDEDTIILNSLNSFFSGETKKAENLLVKLVSDSPKNYLALKFLAEVYAHNQNYFEAIAAYLDLSKLTKENYDPVLCELNTLYSQYTEAEKFCKNSYQLNNKNPYPFIFLGIAQREKLNLSEALQYFKKSLLISQTEMGYVCLAEIFYAKGKYDLSSESFKRATVLSSNSVRASIGLGWANLKNKNFSESLQAFRKACLKDKKTKTEIRKAYKELMEMKTESAKSFAELSQSCGT